MFNRHLGALSLGFCLLAGCASTGNELAEPSPYVQLPDTDAQEDIGFFLADFQLKMQLWNRLKLELTDDDVPRELKALERDMCRRSRKREDDLLNELEVGPPTNRATAAVALGFTGYVNKVSPLLAAVSDQDAGVAQNAALGLGLLAWPKTNTSPLRYELINNTSEKVRSNCAYALLEIASQIQREERSTRDGSTELSEDSENLTLIERRDRDRLIADSCREGLLDSNEGVRVQCAAVLGLLRDADSVEALSELLYDEWNLPAGAAATAMVHIAREHDEHRGPVARALVTAHEKVERKRAKSFKRQLGRLAGRDLGDDFEDWRSWAYDLP